MPFYSFWVDPWSKGNDLGNSRVWLGGSQGSAWNNFFKVFPDRSQLGRTSGMESPRAFSRCWAQHSRAVPGRGRSQALIIGALITGEFSKFSLGLNLSCPGRGAVMDWSPKIGISFPSAAHPDREWCGRWSLKTEAWKWKFRQCQHHLSLTLMCKKQL